MIEVVERKKVNEAPAESLKDLFDRLIRVVGRTLVIRSEYFPGYSFYGPTQTGALKWAEYGNPRFHSVVLIGIGDKQKHLDLQSAVWALIDEELVPIHIPEGVDRSYSSRS